MKYLLFLLLFSSCSRQWLVVREETPTQIDVFHNGKYWSILKDSNYVDYYPWNYGRRLMPGNVIWYSKRFHRVEALQLVPIPPIKESWLELNYPDNTGQISFK